MIEKTAAALRANLIDKNSPVYIPEGKECFFPSHKNIIDAFRAAKTALFVNLFAHKKLNDSAARKETARLLKKCRALLVTEIQNTLCLFSKDNKFCGRTKNAAQKTADKFIATLPEIQKVLLSDIKAAYDGDPAASDPYQILLCYPGLRAICYQRMAHFFYKEGVQIIPRIITEYAHSRTGIDIHPGAEIGKSFFIDHGTGVVIGETAVIGHNVKIYQGVTLGAKSFPLDKHGNPIKGVKRHPNVGNNVTIYANATILGAINIKSGAVIGANSWVTRDIK
ncbi:MAG: serine acetyltransferase [Elusimicrobia bacterium]|nr:serine acetyltransferase [Elusimicrobiota bacterium]